MEPGVIKVNWTAAGSSDSLVTGIRYALYSQCGAQTTFQLIDVDIQGLSYNITTLPTLTQCALRVVVYSDHCLLDLNGPFESTTDNFTTGELSIMRSTDCVMKRLNVMGDSAVWRNVQILNRTGAIIRHNTAANNKGYNSLPNSIASNNHQIKSTAASITSHA